MLHNVTSVTYVSCGEECYSMLPILPVLPNITCVTECYAMLAVLTILPVLPSDTLDYLP